MKKYLTAAQIIEKLSKLPPDLPVVVDSFNDYCIKISNVKVIEVVKSDAFPESFIHSHVDGNCLEKVIVIA
jgi:hypothetical protein